MNNITIETLESCLNYTDTSKISGMDYGTFIRALVYTIQKGLPIEIMDNLTGIITKAELKSFSLSYKEGEEGVSDNISIKYTKIDGDVLNTLELKEIGPRKVTKDKKSGSRTFYRYYLKLSKNEDYRITFNRRISKE